MKCFISTALTNGKSLSFKCNSIFLLSLYIFCRIRGYSVNYVRRVFTSRTHNFLEHPSSSNSRTCRTIGSREFWELSEVEQALNTEPSTELKVYSDANIYKISDGFTVARLYISEMKSERNVATTWRPSNNPHRRRSATECEKDLRKSKLFFSIECSI